MMMVLYYNPASPPARCVYWICKILGLDVSIKLIDFYKKDHLSEDFLKLNPQHLIPTLVDDGLILWESGAIAAYLANAYGKDDKLYPKDPKKRAVVDQRLHFANGTLFSTIKRMCFPIFFLGEKMLDSTLKKEIENVIGLLNKFLEGNNFVAGDHYTIADIALVTLVSSLEAAGSVITANKNVKAWLARCKNEIPGYDEVNQVGADQFAMALRAKLVPVDQFNYINL